MRDDSTISGIVSSDIVDCLFVCFIGLFFKAETMTKKKKEKDVGVKYKRWRTFEGFLKERKTGHMVKKRGRDKAVTAED